MTIAEWLESDRHYHTGLLLLEKNSVNRSLISILKTGENSFTRAKLVQALQDLVTTKGKVKIKINIDDRPAIKVRQECTSKSELLFLTEKKNLAFKEMASLHAKLKELPSDIERYNHQVRILELDSQIDDLWHKIDYFNEHGHLPPDENEQPINTIRDVVNAFKNIPTYISKINTRLKNEELSDEDRDELCIKKNSFVSQLEKLEAILDEPVSIQHTSR